MEIDYLKYGDKFRKIDKNLFSKYRFHSNGILTNFFQSNKSKFSCIVSKEYMYEKSKKVSIFKRPTVWESRYFDTNNKEYYDGTILFGLESGIYFDTDFMDGENETTFPEIHFLSIKNDFSFKNELNVLLNNINNLNLFNVKKINYESLNTLKISKLLNK